MNLLRHLFSRRGKWSSLFDKAPTTARYWYNFEFVYDNDDRREAKEKKMKLEPGKYYEMSSGDKWFSTQCAVESDCVVLGGWHYNKANAKRETHAEINGAPIVMCEYAPLTLIPGELYEMENGKVERCVRRHPSESFYMPEAVFDVAGFYYYENGRPASPHSAPKILHRLRVNEHMKAPDDHVADTIAYHSFRGGTIPALTGLSDAEDALSAMPRVTYRKVRAETEACKREVVIPGGYERVFISAPGDEDGLLQDRDGIWQRFDLSNAFTIRPIAKPFRITGVGWYRTRGGGWVKDPHVIGEGKDEYPQWYSSGRSRLDKECAVDLTSRATAAQAAILDAL